MTSLVGGTKFVRAGVNAELNLFLRSSIARSGGLKIIFQVSCYSFPTIYLSTYISGLDKQDDGSGKNVIYLVTGRGHRGWSRNVTKELGNYDYLMGMNVSYFFSVCGRTGLINLS